MNAFRKLSLVPIVVMWLARVLQAAQPATITVQADRPAHQIPQSLWGIFFEEINRAGDGGLYAEMILNRSFEDSDKPEGWELIKSGDADGDISIDTTHPLNEHNGRALKLTIRRRGDGRLGVANQGFKGMAVRGGEPYILTLQACADDGYQGPLAVSLETRDGSQVLASGITRALARRWEQSQVILTPRQTSHDTRLVISPTAARGTVWLDMVSLFPTNTFKNRPNGLRADLAQFLLELQPAFVRFPGGCWVEGERMELAYRWKQTIGELSQRRNHRNIWGYYSTHGLGFHEYLQLCEDLGAQPLFVINCGMAHRDHVPMEQMLPYVQDALDAIEYANGPPDSQWGSLRARAGHPQPFNLKYIQIGNENGGPLYHERYALFYDAIKAKYPDVKIIANFWAGGRPTNRPVEILDEHYYSSAAFFLRNASRYDSYDRGGPKIYVGEFAVTQGAGTGNLRAAVAEAAFMTGIERNSDVVIMASYAPLLAHVSYKAWNPDLIYFDASRVYGTPSYYVQKLFADNRGQVLLPTDVQQTLNPPQPKGAIGVGAWLTQAEYKDIKVQREGQTLFESDFTRGIEGWTIDRGQWEASDGLLRQTGNPRGGIAFAGDPGWSDYTLSLKARKLGGAEGFLILFHVGDARNYTWWNIGGWGNTRHGIEQFADGANNGRIGDSVNGSIETGRWYDVQVQVQGAKVRCYLDGTLIHEATYQAPRTLFATASRDDGQIILKVVNAANQPQPVAISLQGLTSIDPVGSITVLTSENATDENSFDQPTRVAPVQRQLDGIAERFTCDFPANSVNVVRIKGASK